MIISFFVCLVSDVYETEEEGRMLTVLDSWVRPFDDHGQSSSALIFVLFDHCYLTINSETPDSMGGDLEYFRWCIPKLGSEYVANFFDFPWVVFEVRSSSGMIVDVIFSGYGKEVLETKKVLDICRSNSNAWALQTKKSGFFLQGT